MLSGGPAQAQVMGAKVKPAAELTEKEIIAAGQGVVFPYDLLETVLGKTVSPEGEVQYSKVKGDNDLAIFARAVALADLSQFPTWTLPVDPTKPKEPPAKDRRPELAFWINAYNGLFLKALADAYPVNSPAEIPGLDTAKTRVVAGKSYSFEELRRKIATEFDPVALFALQTGTRMGPRVQPRAIRYSGLQETLEELAYFYVMDSTLVGPFSVGTASGEVEVSPWLQSVDEFFKPKVSRNKWEGIRNILRRFTKTGPSRNFYLNNRDFEVKFMPSAPRINEVLSR